MENLNYPVFSGLQLEREVFLPQPSSLRKMRTTRRLAGSLKWVVDWRYAVPKKLVCSRAAGFRTKSSSPSLLRS